MLSSTKTRATAVAVIAATLTLAATTAAPAAVPAPASGVLLVAHRGAVDGAPESTLAAVDQAVADHADRLSIDVHLTRDGVPVVVHDLDLARTTDVERVFPGQPAYPVQDYTSAQVKRLDTGSWYPGRIFTGSRMLTLDELLTELSGSPSGLTVEAKNPAVHGGVAGIGTAIVSVLDHHPEWSTSDLGGSPRLVLESFDWDFLDQMHVAFPTLPLVLLGDVTPADLAAHPYVREIDVRQLALTPEVVAAAHQAGVRVGTWTTVAAADTQRVLDLGANAVTTNAPRLVRTMLARQGLTWTGTTWPVAPATARVDVSSPSTAPVDGQVLVTATPRTGTGTAIRWQDVTFQSRVGGLWRTIGRNATGSHGTAVLSLAVNDTMRVRAVSAGRVSTERGITAVTARVVLPQGAPSPSVRLAAQPRPSTAGADPRVSRLSAAVWRTMVGRTWHPGCPVGRARLRTLRVSYWGFDGHRHRGELVVARESAAQLGRAFSRLYTRRLPVRSLHRPDSLGGAGTAVARALSAGSAFGYTCQRVPGDTRPIGTHARGTVVSVNPWENPTRVSGRGVPDSWWLSRARTPAYVHRVGSPVVRAFAAEGFAWVGGFGRYADFRDVR